MQSLDHCGKAKIINGTRTIIHGVFKNCYRCQCCVWEKHYISETLDCPWQNPNKFPLLNTDIEHRHYIIPHPSLPQFSGKSLMPFCPASPSLQRMSKCCLVESFPWFVEAVESRHIFIPFCLAQSFSIYWEIVIIILCRNFDMLWLERKFDGTFLVHV